MRKTTRQFAGFCLVCLTGCTARPQLARLEVTPNASHVTAASAANAISNNGGTLQGDVALPDSLIAASAGVLSQHGNGVLSNNGALFAVLSAASGVTNQLTAEGFSVSVLDAGGQPVLDGTGQAFAAQTDAQGRYTFTTSPRGHNLLLAVALPGALGQLWALLPDAAAGQPRAIAIEGVSTHVVGFVVSQYVKSQQAALDRVSAADTDGAIAQANAVLTTAAAGKLVTASLSTDQLVATIGVWRGLSPAFDQDLSAIQKKVVTPGP